MKNKTLNKLVNKLIFNNKFKLLIISLILTLAMSIFVIFGNANSYLQNAQNYLDKNLNAADFNFTIDQKLSNKKLNELAKKYDFRYQITNEKNLDVKINTKNVSSVVMFDQQGSVGLEYQISTFKQEKINKYFLISGRSANKGGEINVTPQLLSVLHKKLNQEVKIKTKNYKIVGVYGTPTMQKAISTYITDKNQYILPVMLAPGDFNKLKLPASKVVAAKFNENLSTEQRKNVYQKIKNDHSFKIKTLIPKFKHYKEKIEYNRAKLCGDENSFNNYAKLKTLTLEQFNTIKQVALQALNGGSCRQTYDNVNDVSYQTRNITDPSGTKQVISQKDVNVVVPNQSSNTPQKTFVAGAYQPSQNVLNEINNVINDAAEVFSKITSLGGNTLTIVGGDIVKYQHANEIVANLDSLPDTIDNTVILKGISGTKSYPLGTFGLTKWVQPYSLKLLKDAYKADKIAFEKENAAKKAQVDTENKANAQKNQVQTKTLKQNVITNVSVPGQTRQVQDKIVQNKKVAKVDEGKIETKVFTIIKKDGFDVKYFTLLGSITDKEDLNTSNAINVQMHQQTMLSWLLFIMFTLLAALLIIIVLQKIINDNKPEFGVLKALGIKTNKIVKSFLKIPLLAIIIAFGLTIIISQIGTNEIIKFLNNDLYIPNVSRNVFNLSNYGIAFGISFITIMIYVYIAINTILNRKTLNLLNNIKDNHNKKNTKFVTKLSTKLKLSYATIMYNKDKSLVVFTVGLITTMLISLVTLMLFSASTTFGQIGQELSYSNVVVEKKMTQQIASDENQVFVATPKIYRVLDKKNNLKVNPNTKYNISNAQKLNLEIIGATKLKSKGINLSTYQEEMLNSGLILPAKYQQLYNLSVGDKLIEKVSEKKELTFEISGFQNQDENVFAYTTSQYLSSVYNNLGKANAHISQIIQPFTKNVAYQIDKNVAQNNFSAKLNQIINIVIIVSVIITLIIIPLIIILTSNIIDSNIKTIATLKAIGFSIGKIRGLILNPYILIFIIGQICAMLLNFLWLGQNFSNIFFNYLGYEVVYHFSFEGMIMTIIVIILAYQLIIILGSQRINAAKIASILNNDGGVFKISAKDMSQYFKTQIRSSIDLDKPRQLFSYKWVTPLTKDEKKLINKEMLKKGWPLLAKFWFNKLAILPADSIGLLLATMYKTQLALMMPINSVMSAIEEFNLIETVLTNARIYLTQAYKNKDKKRFQEIIYFEWRVSVVYLIAKIVLSVLLMNVIATLVGLNQEQRTLLPIVIILSTIGAVVSSFAGRGMVYASYTLNFKPGMYLEVLSKISLYSSHAMYIFGFMFIKTNTIYYVLVPFVLGLISSLIIFILSFILVKDEEFLQVKISHMFKKFETNASREVFNSALPALRMKIIQLPMHVIITIISAKVTTSLINQTSDIILFQAQIAFIGTIISFIDFTSILDIYRIKANQFFADNEFIQGLSFYVFVRKISLTLRFINITLAAIPTLILLPFYHLKSVIIWYYLIQTIGGFINSLCSMYVSEDATLLVNGGEFKFSAYFNGFLEMFMSPLGTWLQFLVITLNLPIYFIPLSALCQNLIRSSIAIIITRKRLNRGSWLYSVSQKRYINQISDQWQQYQQMIKRGKNENNNK